MTQRQQTILQILREANSYITTEAIALQIGYSQRTVRSEMTQMKQALQALGFDALRAKTNMGYRLQLSEQEWQQLMKKLDGTSAQTLYSEAMGGKYPIIEAILKSGTVQMTRLENEVFASYKNVAQYVEQAAAWLEQRNILLRRRRGYGISVDAELHWVRLALWSLFSELEHGIVSGVEEQKAVYGFFTMANSADICEAVRRLEEKYALRYSYESYRRLTFFLAAMVVDARKKRQYHFPFDELSGYSLAFRMSEDCMRWMMETYQTQFPPEEQGFLQFVLASSEIMCFETTQAEQNFATEHEDTVHLVDTILSVLSGILRTELQEDALLRCGLLHYLSALGAEVRYGSYPREREEPASREPGSDIYIACWAASHLLEEALHMRVTVREIDNIAAHIASAMERKSVEAAAYIICSYGVGTSQLLREQMKRNFPNVHIIDVLTPRDLQMLKSKKMEYDFILSTVPLHEKTAVEVVRIGNRLQQTDILAVQKVLGTVAGRKRIPAKAACRQTALPLFLPELVSFLSGGTKETVLHTMCGALLEKGYVDNVFEKSVLKREASSSTMLSRGVVIPHGFPELVNRPCIAVAFLEKPVEWTQHEKADVVFLLALSMEEQFGAPDSIVAFYKALVTLLEDEKRFAAFRALRDKKEMLQYLQEMMQ